MRELNPISPRPNPQRHVPFSATIRYGMIHLPNRIIPLGDGVAAAVSCLATAYSHPQDSVRTGHDANRVFPGFRYRHGGDGRLVQFTSRFHAILIVVPAVWRAAEVFMNDHPSGHGGPFDAAMNP